jgi:hypothetical protein
VRTFRKARLAALLDISKQLLGHHSKGALRDAVTDDGEVNIDHPAAVAWLHSFEVTPDDLIARDGGAAPKASGRPARAPTTPTNHPPIPASAPTSPRAFDSPPNAEQLYDLTFREIATRYGSLEGFEAWIDMRKKTAETRRIELQNAETDGRLISRALVRTHVFGAIENANRRLLNDSPQTLALRISGAVKAGASIEEIKLTIRDHISQQLAAVKTTASRVLRDSGKVVADD